MVTGTLSAVRVSTSARSPSTRPPGPAERSRARMSSTTPWG